MRSNVLQSSSMVTLHRERNLLHCNMNGQGFNL